VLEKYLNKQIIVEEKLFHSASTISENGMARMAFAVQNRICGILTGFDDNFIELDNSSLIERKYIYRIILK